MGKLRLVFALILTSAMLSAPSVVHASSATTSNVQTAALAKFTSTPTPLIVGHASVGTTLSVTVGNWIPAPETTEIKWMVGATVVSQTSTYTIQASDRGKFITVSVTASATGYQSVTKSSVKATATGVISSSGDPQIASIVHQGDVLTASVPTFDPTPAGIKYQWFRAGSAISGATKLNYTSVAGDLNKALTFKVTATLPSYDTLVLTSNASEPVVLNAFGLTNTPTLNVASPVFGNVITGSVVAWSPIATSLSFQWFRDTSAIGGATKITYTAAVADIGHALKLRVVGAKSNYSATTLYSDPTEPVIAATLQYTASPSITGIAMQGQTLTANTGSWTPASTKLSYQWLRGDAVIAGASSKTYKLQSADVSHQISVRVTASLTGHTSVTLTSEATGEVQGAFTKTSKPAIVGQLFVGRTLTVNTGQWAPLPDDFSYQWLNNGAPIEDATEPSYTITSDDFGGNFSVRITGEKASFGSVTLTSAAVSTWPTVKMTVSASDLYDACTSLDYAAGDPCDSSGSNFWFNYTVDNGFYGSSFTIATPVWGILKWRATLNTVKKPDNTTVFDWYAIDLHDPTDNSHYDATINIAGRFPAAGKSITSPWSVYSVQGDVTFEIWASDYSDLYIKSVTIEYYPDYGATEPAVG